MARTVGVCICPINIHISKAAIIHVDVFGIRTQICSELQWKSSIQFQLHDRYKGYISYESG